MTRKEFSGKAAAAFAQVAKCLLGMLYGILKCFPSRNKVVFLSRQSDKPGLDFMVLRDDLLRRDPNLETVMITRRLEKSPASILRFGWLSLVSMYHLATSRVCVLDSYWPVVSLLRHKESLTVIQMWHAIGKLKQSGYQTLDKGYGRNKALAEVMNMHKGYDVVIAGGRSMNSYYCASFGVREDQLLNIGLPRIDYLLKNEQANREFALSHYPQLKGKTVVLYAPTFRRGTEADYSHLIANFPTDRYCLIVKPHPNQKLKDPDSLSACQYSELTTMQALDACDIVITDYSAISLEAAVLCRPIYFYLFDYQTYLSQNGVNIDPYREMPHNVYENTEELVKAIETGNYNMEELRTFRNRYLPEKLGEATKRLSMLILDCIKDGKNEGIRKNLHREAETGIYLDI